MAAMHSQQICQYFWSGGHDKMGDLQCRFIWLYETKRPHR